MVVDRYLADLGVAFARNGDFQVRFQVAVAAAKFGLVDRIGDLVAVRLDLRGMIMGRPDFLRGDVAHVNELPPVIARGVGSPARDREIVAAAVAAAGVGDHDAVLAVGE